MAYLSKAQKNQLILTRNELMSARSLLNGGLSCRPGSDHDLIQDAQLIHDSLGYTLDRLWTLIEESPPPIRCADARMIEILGHDPDRTAIIAKLIRNTK